MTSAGTRSGWDPLLSEIADYVCSPRPHPESAYDAARCSLLDALSCALLSIGDPGCGRVMTLGANSDDPVATAFALGTAIRWQDFNDTWLAAEWGHPSDNLGAILSAARAADRPVRDVLTALIRAYEIQGVLALDTAFNRRGLDHVVLVRVASAAVSSWLLGANPEQVRSATSHAFADGVPLRVYRHSPNVTDRKSWAAGDATSRGLWLAMLTLGGEPGLHTVLSAPQWGFEAVVLGESTLRLSRRLGSYVVENVLYKARYPTEFHAQTAAEAAVRLHPVVRDRLDEIARIELTTQEAGMRIINKSGPLHNPADRDHCLQYVVAVGLLRGGIEVSDYADASATDPRIDRLRALMTVAENPRFTRDYLDPAKRSVSNAIRVVFTDGSSTPTVKIDYPAGHPHRRSEGLALLDTKLRTAITGRLSAAAAGRLLQMIADPPALDELSTAELLDRCALGRITIDRPDPD